MHKFIILGALFMMPALSAGPLALSARVGAVRPSVDIKNTLAVGLNAHLQSGPTTLVVSPYVDYWAMRFNKDRSEEWQWRLYAAGISALKPFRLHNSATVPYIGAGTALHVNVRRVTQEAMSSTTENEIDLALIALAGVELPLSPTLNGFVEFKYAMAGECDYYGLYCGVKFKTNP
ncbi:hypothetical protein JW998_08250 [candidate division KSB1 bacterium]|nr:hypothetical protein [candidate division KSB1 bacterium]